jgi:anti-anti-sigma factor
MCSHQENESQALETRNPICTLDSQGGFMTSTISCPMETTILPVGKPAEVSELTELVRGHEQSLLARFAPLVRRQDVSLDLGQVQRIDAAGISVLISLYASARETGHRFSVSNLSPRVAETLALVGLERILESHIAVNQPHSGLCFEWYAA